METRVIVMRHGEREDFVSPYIIKRGLTNNADLTPHGEEQASESGRVLSNRGIMVDRVFSSPFVRCVRTAVRAGMEVKAETICLEHGLSEMFSGDTHSPVILHSMEQMKEEFPGCIDESCASYHPKVTYPETSVHENHRFLSTLDGLVRRHKGSTILCLTHAAPLCVLLCEIGYDLSWEDTPYASFGEFRVESVGDGDDLKWTLVDSHKINLDE
jgi:broad specificity phosphatase PhoE